MDSQQPLSSTHRSNEDLQRLLDQWSKRTPEIKQLIMERAVERLRRLACKMLHESFPRVAQNHDLDSVINETWMRLAKAMEQVDPPTVQDFFRLAAHKIRQVLLDMARTQRLHAGRMYVNQDTSLAGPQADPSQETYDPVQLNAWTEFHDRVSKLEDQQRQVFEMHYYLELPQAQIAELMEIHPRQVSRLWIKATEQLTNGLDGLLGGSE